VAAVETEAEEEAEEEEEAEDEEAEEGGGLWLPGETTKVFKRGTSHNDPLSALPTVCASCQICSRHTEATHTDLWTHRTKSSGGRVSVVVTTQPRGTKSLEHGTGNHTYSIFIALLKLHTHT